MSSESWVMIVVGVLTPILGGVGAWGAVKFSLGTLVAEVKNLCSWVEKIDQGERHVDGKIEQRLNDHDRRLADIDQRGCSWGQKNKACNP